MDLRAQYLREAAILGGAHIHPTLDAYTLFVARHPWVFGRAGADNPAAILEAAAAIIGPPPSRWTVLAETSPSGKTLFRCARCADVTSVPLTRCRRGCADTY